MSLDPGWATFINNVGFPITAFVVVAYGTYKGIYLLFKSFKPLVDARIEQSIETEKAKQKSYEESTNTWNSMAKSMESIYLSATSNNSKIDRIDTQTDEIAKRQLDPESLISNFHTNDKLNNLIDTALLSKETNRKAAKAAKNVIEGLQVIHPEHKDSFQEALTILEEIEQTG